MTSVLAISWEPWPFHPVSKLCFYWYNISSFPSLFTWRSWSFFMPTTKPNSSARCFCTWAWPWQSIDDYEFPSVNISLDWWHCNFPTCNVADEWREPGADFRGRGTSRFRASASCWPPSAAPPRPACQSIQIGFKLLRAYIFLSFFFSKSQKTKM